MNVETEELPNSEVALSFEVEPARLERALDAAARRLAQRVNIAGFRRGKAPRPLVERVLGKESVLEEALEHLLPEVYQEIATEQKVRGLTEPQFDVQSVSPLRAKATVVVPPAVGLGDYRSVRHDEPNPSVTAAEVEEALERLQDRHAEWVPVDRAAEMGDTLVIEVFGESEGSTVVRRQEVEYLLEPGRTAPVPGFVGAVVGMLAGDERSFELAGPVDDERQDLAGKLVTFNVVANEVRMKELPELDDYFARTVGEYETLEDLRSAITADLLREAQSTAEEQTEREIVEQAVAVSTVAVPEKLLDQEMQRARERLTRNLDTYGISTEQYNKVLGRTDSEADESLRTRVENDLRQRFVLEAIAAQEGLAVTEADVDARIAAVVRADGTDQRSAARIARDRSVRDRVRATLFEERGAHWLLDNATGRKHAPSQEEESS